MSNEEKERILSNLPEDEVETYEKFWVPDIEPQYLRVSVMLLSINNVRIVLRGSERFLTLKRLKQTFLSSHHPFASSSTDVVSI
jgi:hypothetical protein